MLRIRTQVGEVQVHTLWFMGKWITLYTLGGKRESIDSATLFEASQMHLQMCMAVKEQQDKK